MAQDIESTFGVDNTVVVLLGDGDKSTQAIGHSEGQRALTITVTLDLNPEVEKGLVAQARQRGVPWTPFLHEVVSTQAQIAVSPASAHGGTLKLPALHLGSMGSPHRSDIYDDVRLAERR